MGWVFRFASCHVGLGRLTKAPRGPGTQKPGHCKALFLRDRVESRDPSYSKYAVVFGTLFPLGLVDVEPEWGQDLAVATEVTALPSW